VHVVAQLAYTESMPQLSAQFNPESLLICTNLTNSIHTP
jgi:hypothetical protein